jgi:hypothetical protein
MKKKKSFLDTNSVIVAYNHGAFLCNKNSTFNGHCRRLTVPSNFSHVSHYRSLFYKRENNDNTVLDTRIWKFKEELIRAVNETLIATNFAP